MTNRHPHLIVAVHADLDVDFALVPITGSLVRILANQLKDIRGHGSLAEAAFWDGHPVFFEQRDKGFYEDDYTIAPARPDVHWRHFRCTDRIRRVIYQEGQQVFKAAVANMADVSVEMMKRNNISPDDLNWLVPHQANMRIIEATARRMGIKREQVMINIQRFGNTTAATLPLCLWEWEEKLHQGDNLILATFGAGFTWGSIYVKWGYDGAKLN